MPQHDAVVSDWFRTVGVFASNCHYQADPAPPNMWPPRLIASTGYCLRF